MITMIKQILLVERLHYCQPKTNTIHLKSSDFNPLI